MYIEYNTMPEYAQGERDASGKLINVEVGPPKWFGETTLPAIGERVRAGINNLGPCLITGYFSEENFLGVLVTFDNPPEWFLNQNKGVNKGHLFGPEIKPLET